MRTKIEHIAEITSALVFAIALSFGATQAIASEARTTSDTDWCLVDCRNSACDCTTWCQVEWGQTHGACANGGTCLCWTE